MPPDAPTLHLHVRLSLPSARELRALARRPDVEVVSWKAGPGGRVAADLLISNAEADRLRAAGRAVTVLARLNTPRDLEREVSQINRYADRLARLKRRARPRRKR